MSDIKRKRSTRDLIAELDQTALEHTRVGIVVAFTGAGTLLVWASGPERLKTLNDAVMKGGWPVGLIAVDLRDDEDNVILANPVATGHHLTILTRVFIENMDREEGCLKYLRDVAAEVEQDMSGRVSA